MGACNSRADFERNCGRRLRSLRAGSGSTSCSSSASSLEASNLKGQASSARVELARKPKEEVGCRSELEPRSEGKEDKQRVEEKGEDEEKAKRRLKLEKLKGRSCFPFPFLFLLIDERGI